MSLPIAYTPTLRPAKGDFGAQVEGETVLLPESLAPSLRRFQVQSGEDLLSYVSSFPSAIAAALGWTAEETRQAEAGLIEKLRGRVHEAMIEPAATEPRGFGAFDPSRLRPLPSH